MLTTAPSNRILREFGPGLLLTPILIETALLVFLPPDGIERAEWAQFIGRFHPLVVHFPIALILLVPILDLVGRSPRFAYLRASSGFVLGLATVAATAAALLGWCLGRSGGYSGALVTQHMWGGILLAFSCWVSWLLRTRLTQYGAIFGVAIATCVLLVAFTGYRGGQLSLGTNHLTEHMPEELRHILRVTNVSAASVQADPSTFYGGRIQPIFTDQCVKCHGPDKHKAGLRLDTYKGIMRGGKDGPVVRAGNVKASDLFRRITLPVGHDDFMPKEGKRPLSADQLKLIELWIDAGASDTLAVNAINGAPADSAVAATVADVTFPEIDPAAVAQQRSAIAPAVAQLQKQFPNLLGYESRDSADLHLNASLLGPRFGDRDLAAFSGIAGHITLADLSRTAITDHSASTIAAMTRVRVLRLTGTEITDATLLRLGTLDHLESLNVFGTPVTSSVLPTIAKLPKLAHFYVGQTAIPPGSSIPEPVADKLVF